MIITLEIPDQVAALIRSQRPELERAILEGFAVEAYREGTLSCLQVRLLLGHESRWETEDFLAAHDAWPDPTEDEVVSGADALRGLHKE